jgi:Uncharacterized protein conserved in bacteria (DUF2125)
MTAKHSAHVNQIQGGLPPKARHRKFRFILIAIFLLGAAWSLYWFAALELAKNALESKRLELSRGGLSLTCGREFWDGYPVSVRFNCIAPQFDVKNQFKVRSANLKLFALAYMPWKFGAVADGPTSFRYGGDREVEASHQPVSAYITIGAKLEPALAINVPNLHVSGVLKCEGIMIEATLGEAELHDISIAFEKLNYQPEGRPELMMDKGDMLGVISDDGNLAVKKFELRHGNVRYWGAGNVALDEYHRMAGRLATETNDLDGLLSILEPHLDMNDQQKASFRTILGLLGSEAKSDIIARNGELFVGPFKVADLLPLF